MLFPSAIPFAIFKQRTLLTYNVNKMAKLFSPLFRDLGETFVNFRDFCDFCDYIREYFLLYFSVWHILLHIGKFFLLFSITLMIRLLGAHF